jgi:ubiquinone biosynthesis protein Coq4
MLTKPRRLHLEYLKAFKAFVNFVKNPYELNFVFDLSEGLIQTGIYKLSSEYIKANPEVERLIKDRYLTNTPNLDELLQSPPGSLGYEYAAHIKAQNFDPEFYRPIEVKDDASYITLRHRQTHDIHHIVTGFGTDIIGEVGLQAFYFAQTHSPVSIALIVGVILNFLQFPEKLAEAIDSIYRGWKMGLQAQPYLAQKWEENWNKSLSEWKTELGIS